MYSPSRGRRPNAHVGTGHSPLTKVLVDETGSALITVFGLVSVMFMIGYMSSHLVEQTARGAAHVGEIYRFQSTVAAVGMVLRNPASCNQSNLRGLTLPTSVIGDHPIAYHLDTIGFPGGGTIATSGDALGERTNLQLTQAIPVFGVDSQHTAYDLKLQVSVQRERTGHTADVDVRVVVDNATFRVERCL